MKGKGGVGKKWTKFEGREAGELWGGEGRGVGCYLRGGPGSGLGRGPGEGKVKKK